MIWEEIKETLIFIETQTMDRFVLLEKMGYAMVQEGYGDASYVKALTQRERIFPTGIVTRCGGVAIPHTDTAYVKKEGIALAVAKQPIWFRRMESEKESIPVHLVLLLAVKDPNRHVRRLQKLMELLQDTEAMRMVLSAETKQQVLCAVRKWEERT